MTDDTRYLHLTPVDVWARQSDGTHYVPEAYDADGFIHLTIGEANLLEVANMFYAGDPRDYLVMILDPTRITAEIRFDDDSGRYPHIYGKLNVDSVIAVHPVRRDGDGRFVGFD